MPEICYSHLLELLNKRWKALLACLSIDTCWKTLWVGTRTELKSFLLEWAGVGWSSPMAALSEHLFFCHWNLMWDLDSYWKRGFMGENGAWEQSWPVNSELSCPKDSEKEICFDPTYLLQGSPPGNFCSLIWTMDSDSPNFTDSGGGGGNGTKRQNCSDIPLTSRKENRIGPKSWPDGRIGP